MCVVESEDRCVVTTIIQGQNLVLKAFEKPGLAHAGPLARSPTMRSIQGSVTLDQHGCGRVSLDLQLARFPHLGQVIITI